MIDIKITDAEADKLNDEYDKEQLKPKYLECIYETYISFDLEELGIDWNTVDDYYVKHGTLTVTFKDGTTDWYDGGEGETDYKWSVRENIFNLDWDKVEGLNG